MPNEQTKQISQESQKRTPSPLIILYELDLTKWGEGIARFTNQPKSDNTPIYFRGNLYQTYPIEVTGFEASGSGPNARPKIGMCSQAAIISLIVGCHDLIGAKFTRIKTYECFLDDGETPDGEAIFQQDIYRIERKQSQNSQNVSFELSSVLDQEGVYLPRRQALKNYCYFVYRYWDPNEKKFKYDPFDPCPYTGAACFNFLGQSVKDQAQDVCAKDLNACQIRFGQKAVLPFGGFPGMENYT